MPLHNESLSSPHDCLANLPEKDLLVEAVETAIETVVDSALGLVEMNMPDLKLLDRA